MENEMAHLNSADRRVLVSHSQMASARPSADPDRAKAPVSTEPAATSRPPCPWSPTGHCPPFNHGHMRRHVPQPYPSTDE
jgi:hypothetical protein